MFRTPRIAVGHDRRLADIVVAQEQIRRARIVQIEERIILVFVRLV